MYDADLLEPWDIAFSVSVQAAHYNSAKHIERAHPVTILVADDNTNLLFTLLQWYDVLYTAPSSYLSFTSL